MVFSTVQISMPGTSCAWAVIAISQQGAAIETARAIRPIIGVTSFGLAVQIAAS
jgi:hypothetical protein